MKILFYDAKKYDVDSFEKARENFPDIQVEYLEADINKKTAVLAKGYDAICAFVNADLSKEILQVLSEQGVVLLLMRCAGFNNIDL